MACSTGCLTPGSHKTWGECVRSKNLKNAVSIPGNNWDRSVQNQWDRRIDSYKSARSQGIQPASTKSGDIHKAVEASESTGQAFKAI